MKDQTTRATPAARPSARRPDLSVVAWLRLVRVFQKIQQTSTEEMRREGLSVGQFDVLTQIGAVEGSTQQQVADALLVTKSNVTQLLHRMERAGLVTRRQRGRSNELHLTEEGRRLHDRIVPDHEKRIAKLFAALDLEEQRALLANLRRLDRSLT